MNDLLTINDLTIDFQYNVVDQVNLSLTAGQTLALVGESGCGKSLTALAMMGLIPSLGKVVAGDIVLQGQSLLQLSSRQWEDYRGSRIGMVFQEPMTSLNPVYRVGDQIAEVLKIHFSLTKPEIIQRTVQLLKQVGIASPEQRLKLYPHELSGGMKQRVIIAMALACKPDVLIADEPTTALDVTVQAQILQLLQDLQRAMGMAILLITHNLGIVAHFAQQVAVMYAGRIVELATVSALFANALHPYTIALLNALPQLNAKNQRLHAIKGYVPNPENYPKGCRFYNRCEQAMSQCADNQPPLLSINNDQQVACWAVSS